MIIDVCSDLHIAHHKNRPIDWSFMKNKDSSVLIIAGDLGHYETDIYEVLNVVSTIYEYVVFVDGNHEHYVTKKPVRDFTNKLYKYVNKTYNNVTFLNGNNFLKVDNNVFLGANGWYDWKIMEPKYSYEYCYNQWKSGLNDYRYIIFDNDDLTYGPADLAKKQAKQLVKLVKQFQNDDTVENIIIVTHTIPRKELIVEKNNVEWDSLTASFATSEMIKVVQADTKHKIKAHVYGHTHQRANQVIDGIRYVINARGYPFEGDELGPWRLEQIVI